MRAIIAETLKMRFEAQLRVIRRAFDAAIKVNIKLDLQAANVLFDSNQLIFDRRFVRNARGTQFLASFFGEPC